MEAGWNPIARRAGGVPACRPAVLYIPLGSFCLYVSTD